MCGLFSFKPIVCVEDPECYRSFKVREKEHVDGMWLLIGHIYHPRRWSPKIDLVLIASAEHPLPWAVNSDSAQNKITLFSLPFIITLLSSFFISLPLSLF